MSLSYQPVAQRMTVVVLKARHLPKMDITGLSGSSYLLRLSRRLGPHRRWPRHTPRFGTRRPSAPHPCTSVHPVLMDVWGVDFIFLAGGGGFSGCADGAFASGEAPEGSRGT